MYSKKKLLDEQLESKKSDKKKLIHQLCKIQNEIEELNLDLDFYNDYVKYIEMGKSVQLKELYKGNPKNKKLINKEDENLNQAIVSILQATKKRDDLLESKNSEKLEKLVIKTDLQKKIKFLEEEIKILHNDVQNINNDLLNHYHNLLNEGRDTRKEGLVWIIKEIILLDANVIVSKLPSFLDEQCIKYLFWYAFKDLELQRLIELKNSLKRGLRSLRESKIRDKRAIDLNTFKTSLKLFIKEKEPKKDKISKHLIRIEGDNNLLKFQESPQKEKKDKSKFKKQQTINEIVVAEYLKTKSQFNKLKNETLAGLEKLTIKSIDEFLKRRGNLDEITVELINNIDFIENKEKLIQNEMLTTKKKEMERIYKEIITNDYERRYKTTREIIISAMIGEEHTTHEIYKLIREEKVI